VVQEVEEALDHRGPDARVPGGKGPGPEKHDGPDDLGVQKLPGPGGVASDQVPLEPVEVLGSDPDVGQGSEAGGDAVDGPFLADAALHDVPRPLHAADGLGMEADRRSVASHGDDLGRRQGAVADDHRLRPHPAER
jgi:hypothetical protein